MKPLFILTVAVYAMVLSLYAAEPITDKHTLQKLKQYNKVLQNPILTITGAVEKPDSYVLRLEGNDGHGGVQKLVAFLMKKSGALYIGSGYDKNGKEIVFPTDAKLIKKGVSFSYGHGPKEIYLFTDPECPYCGRFAKMSAGKLDDYTVHVVLFPLSFHKKSPAMVEWIMQGRNDAERKARYDKIMLHGSTQYRALVKNANKPFHYSPETDMQMKASRKAVAELNVRGTPSIYDAKFNPVSQDQLLKHAKQQ